MNNYVYFRADIAGEDFYYVQAASVKVAVGKLLAAEVVDKRAANAIMRAAEGGPWTYHVLRKMVEVK